MLFLASLTLTAGTLVACFRFGLTVVGVAAALPLVAVVAGILEWETGCRFRPGGRGTGSGADGEGKNLRTGYPDRLGAWPALRFVSGRSIARRGDGARPDRRGATATAKGVGAIGADHPGIRDRGSGSPFRPSAA